MGLTTTNFANFLKTLWPQKRVENLAYENQPFLAMVPKATDFYGANAVITVQGGDTQGRSATFSTAQANKGNVQSLKFTITRAHDYALASVTGEVIDASANDEGALAKAWDTEVDSAMHNLKRSLGTALFRDGTGAIGQSNSTATPITLVQIKDIVNWEVGMVFGASPNANLGSPRSGEGTVTAIDRDAGTIAYTGTITSLQANDYLFLSGDANAKIKGLAAWLPASAPTVGGGDAFFSADRSADPVRYAGKRIDISSYGPAEGCSKAANSLGLEGASPTHMFCHYDQFNNIQNDLGSKIQYEELKMGEIAFEAIRINGPTGPIKIVPDLNCPYGYAYMLTMKTWMLKSLGACPKFLDLDGLKMLRESSSDGYEVRLGYYGQLYCTAPGWNAVLTMPS